MNKSHDCSRWGRKLGPTVMYLDGWKYCSVCDYSFRDVFRCPCCSGLLRQRARNKSRYFRKVVGCRVVWIKSRPGA